MDRISYPLRPPEDYEQARGTDLERDGRTSITAGSFIPYIPPVSDSEASVAAQPQGSYWRFMWINEDPVLGEVSRP